MLTSLLLGAVTQAVGSSLQVGREVCERLFAHRPSRLDALSSNNRAAEVRDERPMGEGAAKWGVRTGGGAGV